MKIARKQIEYCNNIVSYGNDKWLDDRYIKSYFDSIQLHFQILKGIYFPESIYIAINQRSSSILCSTNIDPIIISYSNCSFFCVSEYLNNLKSSSSKHKINYSIGRGSHWSLLIYNKCFITWIVSIKGANEKHASQMAKNINCEFGYQ